MRGPGQASPGSVLPPRGMLYPLWCQIQALKQHGWQWQGALCSVLTGEPHFASCAAGVAGGL